MTKKRGSEMRKLSQAMDEAMQYAGRVGYQGLMAHEKNRTEDALIRRGQITYKHNVKDIHGDPHLYPVVSIAGWAYLKETHGIERPADPGRLSLSEALEEAYTPASGTPVIYVPDALFLKACGAVDRDDLDACGVCADCNPVTEEANRITADKDAHARRLSLSEALEEAYTPASGTPVIYVPDAGFQEKAAEANRAQYERMIDEGRYTLEEALSEAYTPKGQATCYHGRGLADTCDDCTDTWPESPRGEYGSLPKRVPGATNPPMPEMGKCPHGYTSRDTCPFCDGDQGSPEDISQLLDRIYDRIAGKAYDTFLLGGQAPEPEPEPEGPIRTVEWDEGAEWGHSVYRGVRVPLDIDYAWHTQRAVDWTRGVRDAQAAAQRSVSAALPPVGDPAYQCTVCKWEFTTATGLRRHSERHSK